MSKNLRTRESLKSMQAAPLSVKVIMTQTRIREWVREYGEEGVYVSLSGGKDSTVLSDLVDKTFPGNHIPRVHVNTGLEYPEIEKFVKSDNFHDVVILRPKKNFKQVITECGYPFISKEVSEAVDGARRFIKSYIDRQTDRQTESFLDLPNKWAIKKFLGQGEYRKFSSSPLGVEGENEKTLNIVGTLDLESMSNPTQGGGR